MSFPDFSFKIDCGNDAAVRRWLMEYGVPSYDFYGVSGCFLVRNRTFLNVKDKSCFDALSAPLINPYDYIKPQTYCERVGLKVGDRIRVTDTRTELCGRTFKLTSDDAGRTHIEDVREMSPPELALHIKQQHEKSAIDDEKAKANAPLVMPALAMCDPASHEWLMGVSQYNACFSECSMHAMNGIYK